MLKIGEFNKLRIVKKVNFGLFLDGFDQGEILLPKAYCPKEFEIGDEIEVFIYTDSEDRLIATSLKPKAIVGEFALLKMISRNNFGVFFDWGLPKDLFVPIKEQRNDMEVGRSYILFIYVDLVTDRVVGSAKIDRFLSKKTYSFRKGEKVDLMIFKKTDLGYKAIINGRFSGVLYDSNIFQQIKVGQRLIGYIKKLREDGKIDLSLQETGFRMIDDLAGIILEKLKESDGFLNLNDKSSPEIISEMFGVSKKAFKKALGVLYKDRAITIEKTGIRSVIK